MKVPGLSSVPELEPLVEGEYDLRVLSAKEDTREINGEDVDVLFMVLKAVEHPDSAVIAVTFFTGNNNNEEMDKESKRSLNRVLHAYDVKVDGDEFDPADLIGQEARGRVSYRESTKGDGKVYSNVRYPQITG